MPNDSRENDTDRVVQNDLILFECRPCVSIQRGCYGSGFTQLYFKICMNFSIYVHICADSGEFVHVDFVQSRAVIPH